MKISSVIRSLRKKQDVVSNLFQWRLIHTGQHYDAVMSDSFFEQLEMPDPAVNLGVSGGSQAEQVGSIMVEYEQYLTKQPCHLTVVVGDVNSTLACALTAKKMNLYTHQGRIDV